MFNNTSILSSVIGIIFLLFSIGWVVFIYYQIRKKEVEDARLDKMIDLGKWFIVSVGMVTLASIVTDSFKERDQDMKEIEVFDKYVNTITQVEGIEKRWLLCEYFVAVSPEGQLKKSWENYQTILQHHRDVYNLNNDTILHIKSKDSLSPEEELKLDNKIKENSVLDNSLVVPAVSQAIDKRIDIDIFYLEGNQELLKQAIELSALIDAGNYKVNVREFKKSTNEREGYRIKENQFRVDSPKEKEKAEELNNRLNLGFEINQGGRNPTPYYISIFIVK